METWSTRTFLLFFLTCVASSLLFGIDKVTSHPFSFHPFNFLLMFFMTISVVNSLHRLRWVLLSAIASMAWASLYMLREWQNGSALYGYGYRPGYVVGDPNYFASSALLCLPLACYFARSMPERWVRWCCGIAVLLILAGITVSGSRGGLVGLAVVVLLMIWYSRYRLRTMIATLVIASVFLAISPTSPVARLLHPSVSDQGAADTRLVLWDAAWRMFRDNPIVGVGYDNWRYISPAYLKDTGEGHILPHNQYLEVLAQMGTIGFLAYVGMFIGSVAVLRRVRRELKGRGAGIVTDAALGIQIGLIGFSVSVFFLSAQFLKMPWFMLAISACLPRLVRMIKRVHARQEGFIHETEPTSLLSSPPARSSADHARIPQGVN